MFGKVPEIFLDRSQLERQVITELGNPSSPYQTSIVYGMRGVGKTTFLTDINHRLAKKKDWIVADLAVGNNLMRMLID